MNVHFTDSYLLNPQHKITVNLIGLGGTGSQVLSLLARLNETLLAFEHPGLHVRAYDGDEVTEANVGRQLFSGSDIGQNKAICLVSRLNRFYGYEWEAQPTMFKNGKANIYISCVDTAAARIAISKSVSAKGNGSWDVPTERKFYWLDFGNDNKTGQVVLGTCRPLKQPKSEFPTIGSLKSVVTMFPELKRIKDTDNGPSCSLAEAINKQDLFINSTLANLGCNILWKLFREARISHHGCFLNLDTMSVNPIKI